MLKIYDLEESKELERVEMHDIKGGATYEDPNSKTQNVSEIVLGQGWINKYQPQYFSNFYLG